MSEIKKPIKKEIPFIGILKQAAQIVWRNKFLLWFGILIALGSPGSLNFSGGNNEFSGKGEAAKQLLESNREFILAAIIIVFAIAIILFIISLVAKAGLIKSVNLIASGKKSGFKKGWKEGKKYLGRLIKLFILFFAAADCS